MKKTGTRLQVMRGTAKKTSGGLMKKDLMDNKRGKIVSKKKSIQYGSAGYTSNVDSRRKNEINSIFGTFKTKHLDNNNKKKISIIKTQVELKKKKLFGKNDWSNI